jgi:glycosyltransferase A (GT-A) superfamily protein (DUF2064 family)
MLRDREADLVLGPNRDGGYYLIGMRRPVAEIFDEMIWSGSHVLSATLKRAEGLGLKTGLAPEWHDIDTPADLAELKATAHRLDPKVAPKTHQWLEKRNRARG